MQFLQIYLRINYNPIHNPMYQQIPTKQQPRQQQANQSYMFSSINSNNSQNYHRKDGDNNRGILDSQSSMFNTQHNGNNGEIGLIGQGKKSKIRRIQSFNDFQVNVDNLADDAQRMKQQQIKRDRINYSNGLISVVIKPKNNKMNPQARNLQSVYPTYPASRTTPTNTQNFYVPSLDHNKSHLHPNYQIQINNDLAQHNNYTYLAVLLFLIFVVCAVMPAQELYHFFEKVVNLGVGGIGLLIGVFQLIWEYLL